MVITSLSRKGQVVLPLKVRQARGWKPGLAFEVRETPEGVLLAPITPKPHFAPTRIEDVFGMAAGGSGAISVEDMDVAVLAEARRRG